MANMQLTKTPMAEQDPQVRNQNFLEVARGYTLEEAMNEAKRCIHCKNPACVSGCPVGIPIPEFLDQVAQGTSLPPMRSCPTPTPCPPSPAGCAPRKISARASASGASRGSRWPSGGWSGS